jgi:hypothetical protein
MLLPMLFPDERILSTDPTFLICSTPISNYNKAIIIISAQYPPEKELFIVVGLKKHFSSRVIGIIGK